MIVPFVDLNRRHADVSKAISFSLTVGLRLVEHRQAPPTQRNMKMASIAENAAQCERGRARSALWSPERLSALLSGSPSLALDFPLFRPNLSQSGNCRAVRYRAFAY